MNVGYLVVACALAAFGYSVYQPTFALLKIPSLNESATDTGVDKPDMIRTKMRFQKDTCEKNRGLY